MISRRDFLVTSVKLIAILWESLHPISCETNLWLLKSTVHNTNKGEIKFLSRTLSGLLVARLRSLYNLLFTFVIYCFFSSYIYCAIKFNGMFIYKNRTHTARDIICNIGQIGEIIKSCFLNLLIHLFNITQILINFAKL